MTVQALGSLLPLPIMIMIAGAVLAPLVARFSGRGAVVASLVACTGATVVLALFAPKAYGGAIITHYLGHWLPERGHVLGIALSADAFGLTFALLSSGIGAVLLLTSLTELGGLGRRELGAYTCLVQLLIAGLIGAALSADLVNMFVWFELVALSSYGLTGFFLERPVALEAAFKIMVMTNIAAFGVFIATAVLYAGTGAANLGQLHRVLAMSVTGTDLVALSLIIAGFGTKAGIMPFHGWLADATMVAPGPASALFSGLMDALGIVCLARIVMDVFPDRTSIMIMLAVLGAISAVLGAVLALAQDDLKRLLAYDTVSQMGVLLVALSVGTAPALTGMVYHLINHALFKTLLFLCAGAILHATGMTRLSEMGALARHRPIATAAFLVGAASISGIPPLNGYASLGMMHDALHHRPVLLGAMLLAQIVTVAALARASYLAFFRRRDEAYERLESRDPAMVVAFGILAAGCVGFGVLPQQVLRHVAVPAAGVLADPARYATGVLTGSASVPTLRVHFDYFAGSEILATVGTLVAGLLLAVWYVRGAHEPRPVTWLRRLHTGSVQDYTAYATIGLIVTAGVLLLG